MRWNSTYLINRIWLYNQRKNFDAFQKHSNRVEEVQRTKLMHYINSSANTDFGREYSFHKIKSYDDFAVHVPITEHYAEIEHYMNAIADGKEDVLFPGRPLFFETTSGSTAQKFIPYNEDFRKEFNVALDTWLYGLYREVPAAFHGKAYWSVSPPLKKRTITKGGIPVGMNADTDYLHPLIAKVVGRILVVPSKISTITDSKEFYIQTWKHILENNNLTFISVWSPNFLLTLIRFMFDHIADIEKVISSSGMKKVLNTLNPHHFQLRMLFPQLAIISCWMDGQAAMWIPELLKISVGIPIQPKGLLSTEGVVTIPVDMEKHALSYTSHFYEFKDDNQQVRTAAKLEIGVHYQVLLTTAGGLFRYNTHDVVECTGFLNSVPLLRFLGRSNQTSDLVGEKLNDAFASGAFNKLYLRYPTLVKVLMIPVKSEEFTTYQILMQFSDDGFPGAIKQSVEEFLRENVYFDQALNLGQLDPLVFLKCSEVEMNSIVERLKQLRKVKDGDFKMPYILPLNFKWKSNL